MTTRTIGDTMNCKEMRENFWSYEHGQLSADLAKVVVGHIQTCSACAAELEMFKQVGAALGSLPELEPSPYFDQKLNASLDEIARRPPGWEVLSAWLRDRYVWTFAVLLVATIGLWLGVRYQQNQELNSMEAVLKVQDKYLGTKGASEPNTESKETVSIPKAVTPPAVREADASETDGDIPEEDLAVVKNFELLENYEIIKQFDLADAGSKGSSQPKVN